MATLVELADRGSISRFDPQLPGRQQEVRSFYAFPRVTKWIEETLPGLRSQWQVEISPDEQLDAILAHWAKGEPLIYDHQFKPLRPVRNGIWEVKTGDLRLFGWFPQIDCFICSAIDDATRVKDIPLYNGYIQQAVRDRDTLDLDEPKFIIGDDPNVVISNFSYP